MAKLEIIGMPQSTFVRVVRMVCEEKGIEYVLTEENSKHIGNIFDMWLMLMLGAKERTGPQYAGLLAQAGFRLNRVLPTTSPVSIVEALPA